MRELKLLNENLPDVIAKSEKLEELSVTVEDHDHRIWAIEQSINFLAASSEVLMRIRGNERPKGRGIYPKRINFPAAERRGIGPGKNKE